MLLVLQFLWFKNAYEMIEKEILEKCKLNLEEAIDKEIFLRFDRVMPKTNVGISGANLEIGKNESIIASGTANDSEDFKFGINDFLYSIGSTASINDIDSILQKSLLKSTGFKIRYTLGIENDSVNYKVNNSKTDEKLNLLNKNIVFSEKNNSFYQRINSKQLIKMSISPSILIFFKKAEFILTISIIIAILIGAVLIYQLITVLNEFKYIQFIKEYVSSVTHDLATPIGNITMSLDLLNMGEFDNDKKVKKLYYTMCIEQGLRQQRKLTRFITVSNFGMTELLIEKEIVNINEYIYSIIDFFNRSSLYSQGRVKFNFASQNESLDAYIDKDLFDSVIINIIENSIKYTVGDVIITLNCTENKQNTIITIKDNGNGIASKDIENIFEYFKRGKFNNIGKVFGYGIGLSYAKKIVEAHNGKIKVKSELNTGVEFTITLPKS